MVLHNLICIEEAGIADCCGALLASSLGSGDEATTLLAGDQLQSVGGVSLETKNMSGTHHLPQVMPMITILQTGKICTSIGFDSSINMRKYC